jgi:hypothetical protein
VFRLPDGAIQERWVVPDPLARLHGRAAAETQETSALASTPGASPDQGASTGHADLPDL